MKVDDIPAGKKLDALVAPLVGLQAHSHDPTHMAHFTRDGIELTIEWHHFSTHLKDAWMVVGQLLDGTRLFSLECFSFAGDRWQATFKSELNKEEAVWEMLHYAYGDTVPLAICRAALKAMGVEEV